MKHTILFLLLISLIVSQVYSQGKTLENDSQRGPEEEIWALEQTYISLFRNASHQKILSMWHPLFLGWPDEELLPGDKSYGIRYLEREYPEPRPLIFKIERAGIRVVGNTAINHYILHTSWKNAAGKKYTQSTRITHTWIKEGSQWKILGGMSNRQCSKASTNSKIRQEGADDE